MKLSKAQTKVLQYMGKGGIYYRFWNWGEAWGHWAGIGTGARPRVNIRSIEKLLDLGLIKIRREAQHHKYYGITDKGREWLGAAK